MMGFRSVFITEDIATKWPKWFRDKYKWVNYPEISGAISSCHEVKFYHGEDQEILNDIKSVVFDYEVNKCLMLKKFVVILLHECGGITRVQIEPDRIRFSEPGTSSWVEVGDISHSYCYGCSDLP